MRLDDLTISDLLSQISAKTPAPGGGAVAPIVLALGAALAQMVVRFSEGKKSLAGNEELHREAIDSMQRFIATSFDLAEADAKAYSELNALWKLDRDDPIRQAQWANAVSAAIDAPMRVMNECKDLLALIERLIGKTNKMLDSDLAIAAILAEASARAVGWNVRINLPLVEDASDSHRIEDQVKEALAVIQQACARIESAM